MYRFLAAIILTAFTAVAVAAKCSDADKQALKKLDKAWGDANDARDKNALNDMLSEDYAAFNLTGYTDKKAALANLDGPAPPPNDNVSISDHYIISCSGNTAVMTHRNELTTKQNGKDVVFYSRSVHVFQKAGDKWRVISSVNHAMNDSGALMYRQLTAIEKYKKRDVAWFDENTDDAFIGVDPDGKVTGKSAMLEKMKNDKTTFDVLEIEGMDANVDGDTAWVIATYHAKGKLPDGTPFEGRRRASSTFVKKHGKWLARTSHATELTEQ